MIISIVFIWGLALVWFEVLVSAEASPELKEDLADFEFDPKYKNGDLPLKLVKNSP